MSQVAAEEVSPHLHAFSPNLVSGESLTMIESIKTPEVVNGKYKMLWSGIMKLTCAHKRT